VNHWDLLRKEARRRHAEVCAYGDDKCDRGAPAEILLAKAEKMTGIRRRALPKDHPLLDGAVAKLERNTIWYDSSVEHWLSLYYQAHEYAHHWLRHGARTCTKSDIDSEASEDKVPLGVHRVQGYGPHERNETDANLFAREFLLPGDVLKAWFTETGLNAEQIATQVGVSIEMVCHQLARSLLTPDVPSDDGKAESSQDDFDLDESQKAAARVPSGPILIAAGPGTGKTRTLVARVLYLLGQGVPPESILVLTFSNKAAEELRARIGRAAPEAAQFIRMETFHSFSLELLRKYGTEIGLPSNPTIIDPVDAMFMLEKSLPELSLDHYQNLYEPTIFLMDILRAVSRAKDENVGPEYYTELAQAMQEAATPSTDEMVAAEKAFEVARVYRFYQDRLRQEGQLDFGDLICRSVALLRERADVRAAVQGTYSHVLVDEYQDVNRASGLLLRELVGDGEGLWAVGDVRQSIHRWRGATTANMRLFSRDFPLAKEPLRLEKNYRSQPPIVDLFSEFVPHMSATRGEEFTAWQKERGEEGGAVHFEIAEDLRAEAQGIAREIKRLRAAGVPYKQQAVICRSHTSLARIAHLLEKEDVPVLYLGDFFERPEVRDMLSLLALACEGDGRGLVRVARFPEYSISLSDVQALRALSRAENVPFPRALDLAAGTVDITPHGQEKMALLARHIDDLCHGRSAWKMVTRYLFVRSRYLIPLLTDTTVPGQQRRLALYQFLQFAHSQLGRDGEDGLDPKRTLLRYIRRLESYGEERQLRQVPNWAEDIDAVRVLTIHASKGLEFSAVYLPILGGRYLPASRQAQHCPPPAGMLESGMEDWHLEEEECLFFVALSRARDYLFLTRAVRYGLANSNASKLLQPIAGRLPKAVDGVVTWSSVSGVPGRSTDALPAIPTSELPVFPEPRLDVYMKCPRKYFYEFVLGLSGKRDDSAYVQFHQCVYDVLNWMQYERTEGRAVDEDATRTYLDEIWTARGPLDHMYATIYREKAEEMLMNALGRAPLPNSRSARPEVEIALTHGRVKLTLDHTELAENSEGTSLLVQRVRTGRASKSEADKPIYGLYHAAAAQQHPRAERRLQILYLSTNEVKDINLSKKQLDNRLEAYDKAILGIRRRQFDPEPSDRECPRCPHYFICPLAEDS
jgi:DNA helicase II / ATP-dependent DNA helicase PcrA